MRRLVQAKDEAAKRFYLRCAEFVEYLQDGRTQLLPPPANGCAHHTSAPDCAPARGMQTLSVALHCRKYAGGRSVEQPTL